MRLAWLIVAVLVALTVAGCSPAAVGRRSASTPAATSAAGSQDTPALGDALAGNAAALSSQTPVPAEKVAAAPRPSESSLAYARKLGGRSYNGEALYFVIGDSVESEKEAQSLLDKAIPRFGDMQSYFVVQRSDSFEGMRPGWWVVVEAYRKAPSDENLQFGRRGFPGAYVKRATVRTTDPIPVYDDLTGQ